MSYALAKFSWNTAFASRGRRIWPNIGVNEMVRRGGSRYGTVGFLQLLGLRDDKAAHNPRQCTFLAKVTGLEGPMTPLKCPSKDRPSSSLVDFEADQHAVELASTSGQE